LIGTRDGPLRYFEVDLHVGLAGPVEHGMIDVAGFEEEFARPLHDGLVEQCDD
jgi:hypothetical protein